MALKTWQGLLELMGGQSIEVKITYDDNDAHISLQEILTKEDGKKILGRYVSPYEFSNYSLIRAMMGLVK